jgi:hypothetical protein
MKIFIHIGDARTGTTSLQSLFTANRAKLLELGVDYPEICLLVPKKGLAQHKLSFSLLPEWPKFAKSAETPREEAWGEFVRYISASEGVSDSIMISSEAFSSLVGDGIAHIRDYLTGHDVKPIFVRRDPESWRRSMREQNIKKGQYVPEGKGKPAEDFGEHKLQAWQKFYDVKCIDYGPNCLDQICAYIGIDIGNLEPVEKRNSQLPYSATNLLNRLNKIEMTEKNRIKFNDEVVRWITNFVSERDK